MRQDFLKAEYLSEEEGYSWTLATRFGEMLSVAEEMFGTRDKTWTILGIEFCKDGPRIFYPFLYKKGIVIQLSNAVANSWREMSWELSHEIIHLLSPSGEDDANVLEEGLAVYFSKKYLKDHYNYDHPNTIPSYDKAYQLVKPILDRNPDVIKDIRKEKKVIGKINKELLLKYIPNISIKHAELLSSKFKI